MASAVDSGAWPTEAMIQVAIERDGTLDEEPDAPAGAFHRLARHLEIIVIEADGAIDEGDDEHHPDIRVMQIAPEQRGDGDPRQDHQPAHGRRALLLQQVTLGPVGADRLALALANAQRPDDGRPEQEHEQQRRDQGAAGAERDVTEDIEGAEFASQARSTNRAWSSP